MISLTSPIRTAAHSWPAGIKLAGLCVATFGLFFIANPAVQLGIFAAIIGLYALPGRVFLRSGMRRLRMLWPFVLVVALWHLAEGSTADGATIILRMLSAVALANLVTMTTRLSDMIDVAHRLMTPLRHLGIETRSTEIAMALVIRMTPVLFDKAAALGQAWTARSRRRPGWRVILPFALLVLDDADTVSDALKARGGLNREVES